MMTHAIGTDEILVRETVPSSDTVRDRFGAIDGLRAVAILAVIAFEVVRLVPHPILAQAASDASQGFTLFLLLSGFSLGYPAVVALTENGRAYLDVGRFAVKRVLRIYPAYLSVLLLTVVIPPLALRYGLPAVAHGADPFSAMAFLRNLFLAGDASGNDGFRALGIIARCYLCFPLLLLIWSRSGRALAAIILAAAVLDTITGAHAIGIGALVPFTLGIVAADVRAQGLQAYRFGLPLALIAGAAAIFLGPALAGFAAAHGSEALRIDPLWSLSLFGVFVALGALPQVERILSFRPLRLLGAASFAISLVVVPVSGFAIRQLTPSIGSFAAAMNAVAATLVVGFVLWQVVDHIFGNEPLRRQAADAAAPILNTVLGRIRADRVVIGRAPAVIESALVPLPPPLEPTFYAPPPRTDTSDLAVVSQRSGSPEELAAEILAMKKRLAERSATLFADPVVPAAPVVYEKPGFYRKPPSSTVETQAKAEAPSNAPEVRESIKMRIVTAPVLPGVAEGHAAQREAIDV